MHGLGCGMGKILALPYVPIAPDIREHPKTRRFLRALGIADDPRGHNYVTDFLLAVGRRYPDGKLGPLEPADLADMAFWSGDATKFAAALVDCGWLLLGTGGYVVVGWEDYGGRVLERRNRWRKEKQSQRGQSQESEEKAPPSDACPADVRTDRPRTPYGVHTESNDRQALKCEDLVVVVAPDSPPQTRCVTVGQLSSALVDRWGTGIRPKWVPDYERMAPFSPAEIRDASVLVRDACAADGSRPNDGLLLRKLEQGRKPRPKSRDRPRQPNPAEDWTPPYLRNLPTRSNSP